MSEEHGILMCDGVVIGTISDVTLELPTDTRPHFPFRSHCAVTLPIHFSSKRKLRKFLISVTKNPRYRGPRNRTLSQ